MIPLAIAGEVHTWLLFAMAALAGVVTLLAVLRVLRGRGWPGVAGWPRAGGTPGSERRRRGTR